MVCAVIVTHNRRELLRECLEAVRAQTLPPDRVLVVDNASTDRTAELLRDEFPEVEVLPLEENEGSAGGFHEGMKRAHAHGALWMWLMDDDTIPTPSALAELLRASEAPDPTWPQPLVLSSRTVWTDGSLHPMNAPSFKREIRHFVAGCEHGVLPLRTATFVSLLVHREAVDRFGLPLAHYFIWSDDIEYTARVTRHEPVGFFVPDSVVEHRTKTPYTSVSDTGGRFYYHVRNSLYMLRSQAWSFREKLSVLWSIAFTTQIYLRINGLARENLVIVGRGLRDGLRPVPGRPRA
jgi:GT2 family glycosyltransferase